MAFCQPRVSMGGTQIRQLFGTNTSATVRGEVSAPVRASCGEDYQKGDFDRESFVNVATQMVTQFFQRTDAF
jgi:hypothetical protein